MDDTLKDMVTTPLRAAGNVTVGRTGNPEHVGLMWSIA